MSSSITGGPSGHGLDGYSDYLNRSAISDAAVVPIVEVLTEELNQNSSLRSLNLSHNQLGASDVAFLTEELRQSTTLTSLDVSYNWLGADSAAPFAAALTQNSSLRILDLSYNGCVDSDAFSMAQALKVNSSLSILNLMGNQLSAHGAASIGEALRVNSSLTTLNLSINHLGTDGVAALREPLSVNPSLISLNLHDNFGRHNHQLDTHCLSELGRIQSFLDRNRHNAAMRRLSLNELCARHFAKCVFESYSQENKNKVYHQIWKHSGKPKEDYFGEKNVFIVDWSIFLRSIADAGFTMNLSE
ncbi:MAG: hypothetical protein V4492_07775 [Chlamydiota bacterium]